MASLATRLGLALFALSVPGGASADTAQPAVLAASCANCHGPAGRSPGAIPSIDSLGRHALAAQLRGFRSGEIEATVMNRIAKGYTDAEIDALSDYLAAGRQ